MRRKAPKDEGSIESRLIALTASLFFSIPTAVIIWLLINKELAYWGGFLGSGYLLSSIAIFAVLAFLFPLFFPAILGHVWRSIVRMAGWLGW